MKKAIMFLIVILTTNLYSMEQKTEFKDVPIELKEQITNLVANLIERPSLKQTLAEFNKLGATNKEFYKIVKANTKALIKQFIEKRIKEEDRNKLRTAIYNLKLELRDLFTNKKVPKEILRFIIEVLIELKSSELLVYIDDIRLSGRMSDSAKQALSEAGYYTEEVQELLNVM